MTKRILKTTSILLSVIITVTSIPFVDIHRVHAEPVFEAYKIGSDTSDSFLLEINNMNDSSNDVVGEDLFSDDINIDDIPSDESEIEATDNLKNVNDDDSYESFFIDNDILEEDLFDNVIDATKIEIHGYIFEGDGTNASPFIIDNSEKFIVLSTAINNKEIIEGINFQTVEIKLVSDIDVSVDNTFIGIGLQDYPFQGVFDGNGYNIKMGSESIHEENVGLFRFTSGAVIKNVTIVGNILSVISLSYENQDLKKKQPKGSSVFTKRVESFLLFRFNNACYG